MKSARLQIIISVITFFLGVVLTIACEKIIDPLFAVNKIHITLLSVLLLLSIVVLFVVNTFLKGAEERDKKWLASIGVPAQLIPASGGNYFRQLMELLKTVEPSDEVLVLTNHKNKIQNAEQVDRTTTRMEYFSVLLEKAQKGNYRRILCFKNGNDLIDQVSALPDWLQQHCEDILMLRDGEDRKGKISVQFSLAAIDADIFIVPGKFATMYIHASDPESNPKRSNSMALIFHYSPNKMIVDELHSWFQRIEGQNSTQMATLTHFSKNNLLNSQVN